MEGMGKYYRRGGGPKVPEGILPTVLLICLKICRFHNGKTTKFRLKRRHFETAHHGAGLADYF